jgi:outer membrane murein-binding lipoprotein Lpp
MNQKNVLIGCGAVLLFGGVNAAKLEYVRIQTRIETTQKKVDDLADELKATTTTVHAAIKSITERFTKQLDERAMALEESMRGELYRIESKPVIVQHPKTTDEPKTFEPPIQPRIVMHSGYSCGPCNAWIATEKAKWDKAGWLVEVLKEVESKRAWPWFEIIERDGTKFEVDGPLTNDKFVTAKRKLKP